MKLLNRFFEALFQRSTYQPGLDKDLSDQEIQQLHLQGVLSHLNFCLNHPMQVADKYETLRENFPDIAYHPQVDNPQYLKYVRLLYPEMERRGDWQEGISYLKLAINNRKAKEDLLESYRWLSLFHSYIADYEQAITFAQKGIELAQILRDNLSLTLVMNHLARVYRSRGDYARAIRYYEEVIQIARQNNNDEELAHSYGSKGLTYWHLKEFENALGDLQSAQEMFIKLNNKRRVGHTFNNMGLVYTDLGLHSPALFHFEKALAIAEKRDDKREFALIEGNIGTVYFFLKQYDTALAYLKRTMRTMDELQNNYRLAKSKARIALIYQNMQPDTVPRDIALQYSKEAYEIGLRYQIIHFEIIGASYQAIILKDMNRINEAMLLSRKAVELLGTAKGFDGVEEEIYFNHYLILKEIDLVEAVFYLKKSQKEVQTKLEKMTNPDFQRSFLNIELHQRILGEIEKWTS
jgi:tetratricopeptide (TPR) repeat protein